MDQQSERSFNWRGFVSVTTTLSFLGMAVTGVVLSFVPSCRIANRTGWHFAGLAKEQWSGLHIWFSLLFLIAATVHLVYNWKCLVGYFKDKTRRHLALRWEWGAAVLLVWVISAGTVTGMIPLSTLLNWHASIKYDYVQEPAPAEPGTSSSTERGGYGQGFGRMTLRAYCRQMGLDPAKASEALKRAGLASDEEMTLRQIADTGNVHPSEVRRLLAP